jgi:hypothetical protein
MSDYIFEQVPNKQTISVQEYYTIIGQQDFVDNNGYPRIETDSSNKIVAKKIIKTDGKTRYAIKIGVNNKLINPVSIYGEEKQSSFLDSVCRASNKFIDVNPKTFELYLNFLKTKNTSWLYNAERELT